MTKIREHRGSLEDSMATTQPCTSRAQLLTLIRASSDFFEPMPEEWVHVKPYTYDARIGWNTYIVTIDNYGVWGFTDGPL